MPGVLGLTIRELAAVYLPALDEVVKDAPHIRPGCMTERDDVCLTRDLNGPACKKHMVLRRQLSRGGHMWLPV